MTTRQKILTFLIACILVSIGAGIYIHIMGIKQRKLITEFSISELEQTAKAALENQQNVLYRIVFDYTYWDDFVTFVQNPDPVWGDENINTILSSFHFDGVWMFNLKMEEVYSALKDSSSALGELSIGPRIFEKLHTGRFLQYVTIIHDNIVLVQAATIHPTGDPDRLTKPYGYFFLVKIWDEDLNDEVEAMTGSKVTTRLTSTNNETEASEEEILVFLPLHDAQAQPIAHVSFSKKPKFLSLFKESSISMQILFMGTLMFILLSVTILLTRWVSIPLKLTGDVILHNDLKKISLLKKKSRDFERIGTLIEEFIHQKKELLIEKEKAQESDRLKSAFLANMSHEIRTPLNGVLGFADLLMEDDVDAATRKQYVGIIISSGQLLLSLINDIVDLSKIESGQLSLSTEVTDISETFRALILFFNGHRLMRERNIHLVSNNSLTETQSHIHVDQQRLNQVLTNLINNAIKFTLEGSIEVGCRIQNAETLLFYVKDTGVGIPEDKLAVIFDRFIQADHKAVHNIEGTGLGLTISKGLVELMGGKIWVESIVDVGSIFYFTLPLIMDGMATPRIADIPSQINPNYSGKKFLVVDDIENNHLLFKLLLERTGATVLYAGTAEKALGIILEEDNIDLILMDLRLPGMNGYEATTQIREMGIHIPIVAQTAYSLEGDKEKALESGCNDYIAKPIDRNELFQILHRFL